MHKTLIYQFLEVVVKMYLKKILGVACEIRIDKGILFAKSWQDLATGEGGGGSRVGGARRGGVGERRRRHRKHPHPLLAPKPRSSFGSFYFTSLNLQFLIVQFLLKHSKGLDFSPVGHLHWGVVHCAEELIALHLQRKVYTIYYIVRVKMFEEKSEITQSCILKGDQNDQRWHL